jgi:hypothetical protein
MNRLDDEVIREAYKRYDNGEPVRDIARSLNISQTYLRDGWHRLGVWTGVRKVMARSRLILTDELAREAYAVYQKGERTAAESALAIGIRADTLRERWRDMGLKTRHSNKLIRHLFKKSSTFKNVRPDHTCVTHEGVCIVCEKRSSAY